MAQNITLLGASYSNVPAVTLPKTGGGTARFDDTSDADAVAGDIASGKTAYVNGAKVTGTNSGGGSSKNVQVAQSTSRASSSTYTKLASLTCSVSGKYDIYWDCFRSSTGGTNGSQLYIAGSAEGNANTTFTNHVQNNHLSNVSLNKDDEVAVYVRSRGSNYYAYCGQLTIVQSS